MPVFAKKQSGGSKDHLVCLHPLTIHKDQSHMSKVFLTLGAKMHFSGYFHMAVDMTKGILESRPSARHGLKVRE